MSLLIAAEDSQPSLLIVDDEPENVRLLLMMLNRSGYTSTAITTDSTSVMEHTGEGRPDLVLLDLHMPVKDGFEVLAKLAPFTTGVEHLPVVIITGDGSPEVKRRALSLGAKDFISKPYAPG